MINNFVTFQEAKRSKLREIDLNISGLREVRERRARVYRTYKRRNIHGIVQDQPVASLGRPMVFSSDRKRLALR